jgi:hypothetical protein
VIIIDPANRYLYALCSKYHLSGLWIYYVAALLYVINCTAARIHSTDEDRRSSASDL